MNKVVLFVSRKKTEADRLMPIIARGNGGLKAFSVEQLPGSSDAHAILFKPPASLVGDALNAKINLMIGFLVGFVKSEKAARLSAARERRIRERYRMGRR